VSNQIQQRKEENPSNVHKMPVQTGDHGAHGDFDARAQRLSPQLWTTTRRGFVAVAGVMFVAASLAELVRRRNN